MQLRIVVRREQVEGQAPKFIPEVRDETGRTIIIYPDRSLAADTLDGAATNMTKKIVEVMITVERE